MTHSMLFRAKGFSLVEMLLVVSIIGVVAGMGIRSSIRSNEQKKVTEAAYTLRQAFMQAKSMALAGKKDCTACGGVGGVCGNGDTALSGWRVILNNASPVTYQVRGECGATNFFSSGEKTLPSNVTVSQSISVLYLPLNKGTSLPANRTITVGSSMTGIISKSFIVRINGEITAVQ